MQRPKLLSGRKRIRRSEMDDVSAAFVVVIAAMGLTATVALMVGYLVRP